MSFSALLIREEDGKQNASVQQLEIDQLPEGDVLVKIDYSCLNYKDGLCLGQSSGLVKNYPHIAGIDFSGTVESSQDARYKIGDKVILTGWRVGELHWGGYSQMARVHADWLVHLPEGLTTKQAMAIGTAGFTSMISVIALEQHACTPDSGPILVTGAAGGVGSVAVAILSQLGYEVAAVTGRPETGEYLLSLGANKIVSREDLNEAIKSPLEAESWAGCIDAVGGDMLSRVLGQMKYGGSVASVGLAGGAKFQGSVIPFLLRGVNLLGIDSVMQPYENRVKAWQRLSTDLPMSLLDATVVDATLQDIPELGEKILQGKVRGRIVIDVNS